MQSVTQPPEEASAPRPVARPARVSPTGAASEALDAKIEGLKEARRLLADCRTIVRFDWQAGRPWAREALFAICAARDRMARDLKKAKEERERQAGERIYLP